MGTFYTILKSPMHYNTLNNKRIITNTFYLYIRMGVTLLVQFYTSRVILNVLGVNDFGLWSVIASFIVSFSFVNGPLTVATQRFLNYEIGKGGKNLNEIFNTSLLLFIVIGIIILLLLETIGVWFLNTHLNIAPEKLTTAQWVFQFSILAFITTFIRMPYESAIIAYERMSFYAIICIIEALLLLAIVYALLIRTTIDKLVLYGALTFISKLAIALCYKIYCNRKINCTRFKLVYNKLLMKEIASFSGWNLFGALSSATATQGINILLNIFFNVTINAAYGIASQVGAGIKSFVSNFQRAANPQIVKSYASGESKYLRNLLCMVCKYSFFLLYAVVGPLMLNMNFLLQLWLGANIPAYTAIFCQLMLIQMLIVCIAEPIDIAVFATGKIRNYQLILSTLIFLNIVISYILLKTKPFEPYVVLIVKCLVELTILVARIYFVNKRIHLPFKKYFYDTILPVAIVLSITSGCMYYIIHQITWSGGLEKLVLTCLIFFPLYGINLWFAGMKKNERSFVKTWFLNKIHLNHIK